MYAHENTSTGKVDSIIKIQSYDDNTINTTSFDEKLTTPKKQSSTKKYDNIISPEV